MEGKADAHTQHYLGSLLLSDLRLTQLRFGKGTKLHLYYNSSCLPYEFCFCRQASKRHVKHLNMATVVMLPQPPLSATTKRVKNDPRRFP